MILVFGNKVSKEFRDKILWVADELKINPNWLMSCIAFETGETFSPSIKNKAGSGAIGLIQFMPATAKSLGTTTEALSEMTDVEQLSFVFKYFLPYRNKIKSLADCYMAILYPKAIGKPLDYVIFDKGKAYLQNRGLDKNKDGKVTKAECAAIVYRKFEIGLRTENLYFEIDIEPRPAETIKS